LEHIPFPAEIVSEIKKSMGRDTILYIEVLLENIIRTNDSKKNPLLQRKKHWHEHINFYTKKSIEALLDKCGLKMIDLKQLEATIGGNSSYLFLIASKLQ
jgi:hypothetical protein